MISDLSQIADDAEYDVVVIGAGGAGMCAALCAAIDGASVLLIERTEYVGGTTAYSAGSCWIPNTSHGAAVAPNDSFEKARDFLRRAVGGRTDDAVRVSFLENGPKAVEYLEKHSMVKFRARPYHPDYMSEHEGAALGGRAVEPLPFDGRQLGPNLALVRPPVPEHTVLGGMMVDRDDVVKLLNMTKSFKSFKYAAKIVARHAMDRLRHPRGTRLLMGNALIARMLCSLLERGVPILVNTKLESLVQEGGRIQGVMLSRAGVRRTVRARGGVILASGGYSRHPTRRKEMLPGIDIEWCSVAPGNTGEAQDLAVAAGARFGTGAFSNAVWAPVSLRKRADGSTAVFPHLFFDRGKPGMITVNQQGRRFLSEATSYHMFAVEMQEANKVAPAIPAFLITDAAGLKRYGLGLVHPGGRGLAPFLADGYLIRADSLAALARRLGFDPAVLEATIARFNASAVTGVDEDFGRGSTPYQRLQGDAAYGGPNPCLGPIAQAPFYAVRLYPSDTGAATGLLTDVHARVLDTNKAPIAGLYACGNDMHSITAGTYPGPGITLGPALTFGYIAARHAVQRCKVQPSAAPDLRTQP
jgi:succinate dehydrogenase/fumarate reductase flavoprotein subunit